MNKGFNDSVPSTLALPLSSHPTFVLYLKNEGKIKLALVDVTQLIRLEKLILFSLRFSSKAQKLDVN